MKWSRSPHRPPHLYLDNAWYFITASALNKNKILTTPEHLTIWSVSFKELVLEFKIKLIAWVILANHYHLLLMPNTSNDIGNFMKRLNGSTSYKLNKIDNQQGRTIWYSYWDTCIRSEKDFWTRFNYIHYNPVKHGYVDNPEDWEFSSYRFYLRGNGQTWLNETTNNFPIYDLFDDDKF
ncbi:MAG: transposase [Anaerolineales bacterium]|nr:transposase [Anaerolineales bacterium]